MISGLNRSTHYPNKSRQTNGLQYNFEDGVRRTNNNFRTSTRGFSVNKSNNKQFKDPDVWDPPPPMQKKQQPIKRASKNISSNLPYPSKNRPGAKKGLDPNGKKSFLYDRYPDGSGPDSNLI